MGWRISIKDQVLDRIYRLLMQLSADFHLVAASTMMDSTHSIDDG